MDRGEEMGFSLPVGGSDIPNCNSCILLAEAAHRVGRTSACVTAIPYIIGDCRIACLSETVPLLP